MIDFHRLFRPGKLLKLVYTRAKGNAKIFLDSVVANVYNNSRKGIQYFAD